MSKRLFHVCSQTKTCVLHLCVHVTCSLRLEAPALVKGRGTWAEEQLVTHMLSPRALRGRHR